MKSIDRNNLQRICKCHRKRNVTAADSDGKEVERKQEQWQKQKKDYLLMPD